MVDVRDGTLYVGWQLRLPARFWGVEYARDTYGSGYETVEWVVTVLSHRRGTKKVKEEWEFKFETEVFCFNKTWCNKFLKEGRLAGGPHYVHTWPLCNYCV